MYDAPPAMFQPRDQRRRDHNPGPRTRQLKPRLVLALTPGAGSQLSVAVGSVKLTRALLLEVHTDRFPGHVVITGATLSVTVKAASLLGTLPAGLVTTT